MYIGTKYIWIFMSALPKNWKSENISTSICGI